MLHDEPNRSLDSTQTTNCCNWAVLFQSKRTICGPSVQHGASSFVYIPDTSSSSFYSGWLQVGRGAMLPSGGCGLLFISSSIRQKPQRVNMFIRAQFRKQG
ncbi:hypothetical protein ATANTOWER_025918 [Ataeniobius toweri]|uniref:Uncharacterized protein n=1 Tax=Ataeniobius toweri TaxID=208326 RepID=A0ABU7C9E8_9TELE|nr:hypothetical protein [Ataeniobius toweri]